MALDINFEVWEQPTNWRSQSAIGSNVLFNAYNINVPSNPQPKTWNQMLDDGKQPKNYQLDFSCAPWRMNANAALLNRKGIYYTCIGSDPKTANANVFSVLEERRHCPFVLCYKSSGLSENVNGYYSYIYSDLPWTGAAHVSDAQIAINFRYDKILVTPMVQVIEQPYNIRAWETNPTKRMYTLDDFDFSNVACVINIGFKIWIEKNGTYTAVPMSPLFDYKFSGESITFQMSGNIPYFAGYTGMKLFSFPPTQDSYGGDIVHWLQDTGEALSMNTYLNKEDNYCKSYRYCPIAESGGRSPMLYNDTPYFHEREKRSGDSDMMYGGIYWNGEASQLYDRIKTELAYLGLPFVLLESHVGSKQPGDQGYYFPVFDANRTTTGDYKDGADALSLDNASWEWIYDLPVLPDEGDEPVTPDVPITTGDTGNRNNRQTNFTHYTYPNSVYALTETQFLSFVNDVNGLYLNQSDDTQLKIDFKGSNPNDYIIGAYGVPFNVFYTDPGHTAQAIKIGPVTLPNAKGLEVDTVNSFVRDCGSVTIGGYGNFLDFEPYTQIELYLPMCGTVKLDPAQVVGRSINVVYYYDILTLSCTACVFRDDDMLITTASGDIGAKLPLTAARMGDYQYSIHTLENAMTQNSVNAALGIATGIMSFPGEGSGAGTQMQAATNITGNLITSAIKADQLAYEFTHKQPQIGVCSSPSGAVAQWIAQLRPWLFIKRCEMLSSYNAAVYSHTVGNACCKNGHLGSFSGYTIAAAADLSGVTTKGGTYAATEEEKNAIRKALTTGIYL